MNKVLQDLMEHLECPVCLHYMSFPITLCRNGHNICARCKYRLPLCPLCNGKFTNIRSIALENMAARIKETVKSQIIPVNSFLPGRPIRATMKNVVDSNLEELVCRICQEYMVPPIPQCTICGIHMCNYCENMKRHCHFRISEVAFIRNGALEAISRQITHRCKFFKSGCTGQFLADFKKEHEEVCWFRDVSCPFDIGYRCGWRGSLHSTSQHIIRSHVYNVLTEASLTEKVYSTEESYFQVLYAIDGLFFHFAKTVSKLIYVICLFIGHEDQAKLYNYTITPKSKCGNIRKESFRQCSSYYTFDITSVNNHWVAISSEKSAEYELKLFKLEIGS